MRTRAIHYYPQPRLCAGFTNISKGRRPAVQTEHCFLTHGDMPTLTTIFLEKSGRYEMMAQYCHSIWHPRPSDFSVKTMLDAGNPTPNVTNMRQALLMGAHYSVEKKMQK